MESGGSAETMTGRKRKRTSTIVDLEESVRELAAYRDLITRLPAIVCELAEDGTTLFVNDAVAKITGYQPRELHGKNWWDIFFPGEQRRQLDVLFSRVDSSGAADHEILLTAKDGTLKTISWNSAAKCRQDGTPDTIIGIGFDITDCRLGRRRLAYLVRYDSLTDLPNRRFLVERLNQVLVQSSHGGRSFAVLFLDLDRFKSTNGTLGHNVGDLLLKAVAARLKTFVPAGDTIARMGNDEFAIIVSNSDITKEQAITGTAERILRTLSRPFVVESQELFITTSIGVVLCPPGAETTAEDLLKKAYTAMYYAKKRGGNNYQVYTPEMNARELERVAMERSLRYALRRNELLLHYQPQVDLNTGQITGMEVLARWQHPDLGLVPPSQFIPLAEETGLIIPIGEWVLRTACRQNKAWQDSGYPRRRVAVNLSARQFQRHDLDETIALILKETNLDPHYLELELTESMVMQDTANAIATMRKLNEMGVRLSIDDFGTGYSSLSYLSRLPISSLKIDKSFVSDITTNADNAVIVKTIITMAHSLHLKVIAEGVETVEQLNFLRSLDCHEMQGYLFSGPLPAENMAALLARDKRLGC